MRIIGITARESGGITVIELKGDIDLKFVVDLSSDLYGLIDDHPERDLIVNIHEVDLIDSYGLSMLLSLRYKLDENCKRLAICSPMQHIGKILEMADPYAQFEIYENENHAIQALREELPPTTDRRPLLYQSFHRC